MTGEGTPDSSYQWGSRDPLEEQERVARHLEMLTDMLADDQSDLVGSPQITSVRISFSRFMEVGDRILLGQEEHLGTLLGVSNLGGEPTAILSGYEVWLHGPDGADGEPQGSTKVDESDIAEIPIRQMNGVYGAPGTAEQWEELEQEDPS